MFVGDEDSIMTVYLNKKSRLMRNLKSCRLFGMWLIATSLFGCQSPQERQPGLELMAAGDHPELLGEGIISTDLNERDLTIAPDGSELYFTLNNINNTVRAIVLMQRDGDEWAAPEVASFSGRYKDIEPYFSPDGQRLYFASTRPVGGTEEKEDYDLWYVERTDTGWSEAQHLPSPVNTEKDEFYPAVAANGNLYFTTTDDSGNEDIFVSTWDGTSYSLPAAIDSAINSPTYEFNAYISPDERVLVFSSYGREDGLGGGDLYVSHKDENGDWLPAVNLGENINGPSLDFCPFVDWENDMLYFSSNRVAQIEDGQSDWSYDLVARHSRGPLNGLGNLYRVKLPTSIFDRAN